MAIGEARLKRQIAGRGAFAHVRLETTPADPPNRFDVPAEFQGLPKSHYVPVVHAAVLYAWEQLSCERKNPPHVNVCLLDLIESACDTTTMAVFYATVLAFCDAIGLQLDNAPAIEVESNTRVLKLLL
jgi:hypothetical protein